MKINLFLGILHSIIFLFLQETVAVKQADATPTSWVVKVHTYCIVHYVTCDYDFFFCRRQVDIKATVSDFDEKVPNMAHTVKTLHSL